jgi:hypothetical protein
MKIRLLFLVLILNSFSAAYAQILKPAKWTYSVSKQEVKVGSTVELIFHVNLDDEWYLYSCDFDPKLDAPHATFTFSPDPCYQLVGKFKAIGAKEKFDEIWEGNIKYFTKTAEFRQTVKILKSDPVIAGTVDGQVCSNSSGKCIRVNEEFSFKGIKVLTAGLPKDNIPSIKNKPREVVPQKEDQTKSKDKEDKDRYVFSKRLTELEKQKEKLIRKDAQGKDETIEFLKAYVRMNGGNIK